MRKRSYKLRKNHFKKGNTYGINHDKSGKYWLHKEEIVKRDRVKRLNVKDHKTVLEGTEGGMVVESDTGKMQYPRDGDGPRTDYVSLRPYKEPTYYDMYSKRGQDSSQYLLVHKEKTEALWNVAVSEHREMSPSCKGVLHHADTSEGTEKRGTVWIVTLKCSKCKYKSQKVKLYDEVPSTGRGRRAAAPNIRLQIATSGQGIGNSGTRMLLTSLNMHPPSTSGLQRTANKVNECIEDENKKDMQQIRKELLRVNGLLGRKKTSIDVEADGRYNNSWGTNWGKTLTQPATQAIYVMAENVTSKKKIISVGTWTRLCSCDAKNTDGPHTDSCRADMASNSVIGREPLYASECIGEINEDGINVHYLTMDGDCKTRRFLECLSQPDPDVELEVLYCVRHLNRLLQKTAKNKNFSKDMFSTRTKIEKEKIQDLFSFDLEQRVQAEMDTAHKLKYDKQKLVNFASYLKDTIINCYMGKCSTCHVHSLVCKPKSPWKRPVITALPSLSKKKQLIKPTAADRETLTEILNIRLSRQSVLSTFKNTSQNKCEATNRAISKTNPKHITHRRNFRGRTHMAIHGVNNNHGQSLLMLSDALKVPFPPQSPAVTILKQIDKQREYHQTNQKTQAYKTRKAELKKARFSAVLQRKTDDEAYKKCSGIKETLQASIPVPDHSYARRPRTRQTTRPRP